MVAQREHRCDDPGCLGWLGRPFVGGGVVADLAVGGQQDRPVGAAGDRGPRDLDALRGVGSSLPARIGVVGIELAQLSGLRGGRGLADGIHRGGVAQLEEATIDDAHLPVRRRVELEQLDLTVVVSDEPSAAHAHHRQVARHRLPELGLGGELHVGDVQLGPLRIGQTQILQLQPAAIDAEQHQALVGRQQPSACDRLGLRKLTPGAIGGPRCNRRQLRVVAAVGVPRRVHHRDRVTERSALGRPRVQRERRGLQDGALCKRRQHLRRRVRAAGNHDEHRHHASNRRYHRT